MSNERFARRYIELEAEFSLLRFTSTGDYTGPSNKNGEWRKWATSAEHLVGASFGNNSVHKQRFSERYQACNPYEENIRGLHAVFLGAKADFEGGYQFDVEMTISGEIFGDFVSLARQSLSDGHKDVAAVLASAALEDALKRYARSNEIEVQGMTMQEVINALKSKSLIGGAQKTLIDVMPKIRNAALHADWEKISESEVGSILGFVEQFLLTKFTPN
jgi:Domain of unknown function (DUF4145)